MNAIEASFFLGYRSLEDFGRSCGCYGSERAALATELRRRGRELEEEEPLPALPTVQAGNQAPANESRSTGGAGEEGASSSPVAEAAASAATPPPVSAPSVGDNQAQRPRGAGGRFAPRGGK